VCVFVCTLAACGVQATCTVLGLTPLDFGLLKRANLLFLLPRSPFGREPLYLQKEREWENSTVKNLVEIDLLHHQFSHRQQVVNKTDTSIHKSRNKHELYGRYSI